MTADKNQPASPGQRVLKMAPQVYYGYPNPQLMHIHADDVQETLPEEELPEEHGGELVGYSPVSVPYRKPSSERAGKEALAYLALAIVADPFVYILGGPILGEETLVSLFGAGVGFSMLSFGILPLVLFLFSLWAVINFFAVMVKSTGKRETEERIKFRLVYEYTSSSEGSQEGDDSLRYGDIDQPVMDPGPPAHFVPEAEGMASVLGSFRAEPLYCGGDSLCHRSVRAGRTRRRSLYGGESGERRAHGDSRHYLVCGVDYEYCAACRSE